MKRDRQTPDLPGLPPGDYYLAANAAPDGTVAPIRVTRERGRRYPRNRACPHCFHLFTPKGIARHVAACPNKGTLTAAAPQS